MRVAFLAGNLTSSAIFALLLLFVGYRVGFSSLGETLWKRVAIGSEEVLELPDNILSELIALNAVMDNAGNPTGALSHYTILVDRDEEVGWAPIPNARISLYMLRARNPWNLNPPVLASPSDAKLSQDLRSYIARQARLHYTYTIGADGFRTTVPPVTSSRKILMVGDASCSAKV